MSKKLKIAVAISSHSPSFFTKLTVGSLIRHNSDHDLNIHIGYHSNLSDYTSDYTMFSDLNGYCQFHAVDEIDWNVHARNLYRYSLMHSVNLQNIFKNIKYYDFDYLVILDNDVFVKTDFITQLISKFPDADLIGTYFQDYKDGETVMTKRGIPETFAPKISVWNMIISRNLFNKIMENPTIIQPEKINEIMYDTFARVLHKIKTDWDMNMGIISIAEMDKHIHHFFSSSFNFGITMHKKDISEPLLIYNQEFPNGVAEYLKTNFIAGI